MLHVCIKLGPHRCVLCLQSDLNDLSTNKRTWQILEWPTKSAAYLIPGNTSVVWCLRSHLKTSQVSLYRTLHTGIARWNCWFFSNGIKLVFLTCANGAELIIYLFSAWKPVARLLRMIHCGWRIQSWWWRTSFAFSSLTSPPPLPPDKYKTQKY